MVADLLLRSQSILMRYKSLYTQQDSKDGGQGWYLRVSEFSASWWILLGRRLWSSRHPHAREDLGLSYLGLGANRAWKLVVITRSVSVLVR